MKSTKYLKSISRLLIVTMITILAAGPSLASDFDFEACRQRVKEITCLLPSVDNFTGQSKVESLIARENQYNGSCLPGTEVHAQKIANLYHRLPLISQRTLCALKRLIIVQDPMSPGGSVVPSFPNLGHQQHLQLLPTASQEGYFMTLSESFRMTTTETRAQQFTRHLQLYFGRAPKIFEKLHFITDQDSADENIIYTINHEVGHIVYDSNQIADLWENLSWTQRMPLGPIADHHTLMLYRRLDYQNIDLFFSAFKDSNFVSLYALSNPNEDFAETFAFYHARFKEIRIVDFGGRTVVDIKQLMEQNRGLQAKLRIAELVSKDANTLVTATVSRNIVNYQKTFSMDPILIKIMGSE
jgi:hypothetical protein